MKNGIQAYLLAVADGMGGHLGGEVASRRVRRLTKDHTVAERMVESGIITPKEVKVYHERNTLLRAIGVASEVEVDLTPPIDMVPGDIFVLCSDGLTEFVEEEEIGEIVNLYSPEKACYELVNMANNRGGTDNITVQVAKVLGSAKRTSQILSGVRNLFTWMK